MLSAGLPAVGPRCVRVQRVAAGPKRRVVRPCLVCPGGCLSLTRVSVCVCSASIRESAGSTLTQEINLWWPCARFLSQFKKLFLRLDGCFGGGAVYSSCAAIRVMREYIQYAVINHP